MKKTLYADLFCLYSQRRAMLRHGMCLKESANLDWIEDFRVPNCNRWKA
jgi:hypothetical protein